MSVCIMSYNVHGGIGLDGTRNYRRIGHLMESQKVDIALIQEFECRPSRRGNEKDLHDIKAGYFGHAAIAPTLEEDGGWYGNLVLSRFPVLEQTVHDITIGDRERPGLFSSEYS